MERRYRLAKARGQSYSWMKDAVLCMHPEASEGTTFAMLKCYMDESGVHDSAPFCVVAGYVASVAHWRKFEPMWKKVLDREAIQEFHAKTFFSKDRNGNRVGEYRGWDDDRASDFLDELIGIIQHRKVRLHLLGSTISVPLFNSYTGDERRFLTGGEFDGKRWKRQGAPTKAYYLPFQHCIIEAAHKCHVKQRIHFFFDLNKQLSPWAQEVYLDLLDREELKVRAYLGQISFPTSLDAVGLQAADLASYAISNALKSGEKLVQGSPRNALLDSLASCGGEVRGFNKAVLDKVLVPFRASLIGSC